MAYFSTVPPHRPPHLLLQATRQSCQSLREQAHIALNYTAIDDLLNRIPSTLVTDLKWLESGYQLPLAYPSAQVEWNTIAHLCFLNSLSGYREDFHRETGQGAHNNIVRLVLSLYLSDPVEAHEPPLSARMLRDLTPAVILGCWGAKTYTSEQHPDIPGLTVESPRRDGLYEAAQVLCQAANDTGTRLVQLGCADLGTYVTRTLTEAAREAQDVRSDQEYDEVFAALFVDKITTALPAFNDSFSNPVVGPVYIHKRAYLLLSWLRARFGAQHESLPTLPSSGVLPAFVDNVIPSLLVHWGILDLSHAIDPVLRRWAFESRKTAASSTIEPSTEPSTTTTTTANAKDKTSVKVIPGPTLNLEQAYAIRAAALDACRAIQRRATEQADRETWRSAITEALVDGYIWTFAKDASLRSVPRMVERNTFMY